MIRKLNRIVQDFLRPKRLALGKKIWDKKDEKIKCDIGNMIEAQNIKSILFLRYDGKIGDMVINTFMFREIKKQFPNIKIGVVACGGAKDIIKKNPHVDKIYDYNKKEIKNVASEIALAKYDLLIDFSEMLRVQQIKFINLCKAKINMGLDKENWNLFDVSFKHPNKKEAHIQETYVEVLKILGIKNINKDYDLHINSDDENRVISSLNQQLNGNNYIVFNPFAASKHRSFNKEKIIEIIKILLQKRVETIIIIGTSDKQILLEEILKDIKNDRVHIGDFNMKEVIILIKNANLIITPDTAIVHIATAFKKNMIGVYRPDKNGENNFNEWGPNSEKAKIIFAKSNEKVGEEIDINTFDMKELEKVL